MGAYNEIDLLIASTENIVKHSYELSDAAFEALQSGARTSDVNTLRLATEQIGIASVGLLSMFEARMQHCFSSKAFFRELQDRLTKENQEVLRRRLYIYYLAVNVLKHGRGRSYETLLELDRLPFPIKKPDQHFFDEGDVAEHHGLIDWRDGFFEGLVETIRDCHKFLLDHDQP